MPALDLADLPTAHSASTPCAAHPPPPRPHSLEYRNPALRFPDAQRSFPGVPEREPCSAPRRQFRSPAATYDEQVAVHKIFGWISTWRENSSKTQTGYYTLASGGI